MRRVLIENKGSHSLRTAHDWPGKVGWSLQSGGEFLSHGEDGNNGATVSAKARFGTAVLRVSFFPPGQSDTPVFTEDIQVVLAEIGPATPASAAVVLG